MLKKEFKTFDFEVVYGNEIICIDYCPLERLWPEGCLNSDSPYKRWRR